MLLAHHPGAIERPWRLLVSGCIAGWAASCR
jgi:hypothetical protein